MGRENVEPTAHLTADSSAWFRVSQLATDVLLVLTTLFCIVLSRVASSMASYDMPAFPSFITWWGSLMCTLGYLLVALCRHEMPFNSETLTRTRQAYFIRVGLTMALNGVLWRFSAPWISGALSQILGCLSIPMVCIFSFLLLGDRLRLQEVVGVVVVMAGVVIGMLPDISRMVGSEATGKTQANPWYWILVSAASQCCFGITFVLLDQLLRFPICAKPAAALFWSNLYSLAPDLIATIPLACLPIANGTHESKSIATALVNQWYGMRCVFGMPSHEDALNNRCRSSGWLWFLMFVIGFVAEFCMNTLLMKRFNSMWVVIINQLAIPLSAIVFASPVIVGQLNSRPLTWWAGASFIVILCGVMLKGRPNVATSDRRQCDER